MERNTRDANFCIWSVINKETAWVPMSSSVLDKVVNGILFLGESLHSLLDSHMLKNKPYFDHLRPSNHSSLCVLPQLCHIFVQLTTQVGVVLPNLASPEAAIQVCGASQAGPGLANVKGELRSQRFHL